MIVALLSVLSFPSGVSSGFFDFCTFDLKPGRVLVGGAGSSPRHLAAM